ncbi:MAG: gamma-glutamyl kinase [Shimia sp.]
MLIFDNPAIVLFAIPRTGTTGRMVSLCDRADHVFRVPTGVRHMSVRQFERRIAPHLPGAHRYTRVAVIRDPLSRLRSWYRYRARPGVAAKHATRHVTFAEFIAAHLSDAPPPWARIGNQITFLTGPDGTLGVDRLFCAERPGIFNAWAGHTLGVPRMKRLNASRPYGGQLDATLRRRLYAAREAEFDLHSQVIRTGTLSLTEPHAQAA